jgi:hypothetical protein
MTNNSPPTADAHLSDRPGAATSIRLPDDRAYRHATGIANLETRTPIEIDTIFNVGSVAKQITAYIAVLAHRSDVLRLDTQARDVLPGLTVRDVTILDLIQHRSGLRDAETLLSLAGLRELDHYTSDDILTLAYRQRSRVVGRDRFLYSNTNYLLLAEALRLVTGKAFPDLATNLVFDPIGMTTALFKASTLDVVTGSASSYRTTTDDRWIKEDRPVTLPGPGSLWCSVIDLERWLDHLHQLWDDECPGPMSAEVPYLPSDLDPYLYGPGLYLDRNQAVPVAFHFGHQHGFSAAARLTRDGSRIACASNSASLRADHLAECLAGAASSDLSALNRSDWIDELAASRSDEPEGPGATPPTAVDSVDHHWLGTFVCAEVPGRIRLSRRGGDLYLWRRGTADRLHSSGPGRQRGPGYSIQLPDHHDEGESVDILTFDLDRAPGLAYRLVPSA